MSLDPLRPHADLHRHYSTPESRPAYVRSLFEQTAPHYEWINKMMSLGSGAWYRRRALLLGGLSAGGHLLDIATGTGLVARAAASIVGPSGRVVGLDPSPAMLREQRPDPNTRLVQALGEALPFRSGAFDFVSLAYGLRHVADLNRLFAECFRVLQPRGRLLVLEFRRPRSRAGVWLGRLYLERIVPAAARLASPAAARVMRYCWDTVDQAVSPETVTSAIGRAGFEDVSSAGVGGIFAEYCGAKRG